MSNIYNKNFCFDCRLATLYKYENIKYIAINPIRTGGPELTIKAGGGAKTPALHNRAISRSFQVRFYWCKKQISKLHRLELI